MPTAHLDPGLRAGWESDVPIEDSLLRHFLANWAASIEAHAVPMGGRALRRDEFAAGDLGRPSFGGNVATLLAPITPDQIQELGAALHDCFGFDRDDRSGADFLFRAWPTPDLSPYGWRLLDFQPLMLWPAGGAHPPDPPDLRIERASDTRPLRAFELARLEADRPGAVFGSAILGDDRLRMWVGWADDRPVSASAAFVANGIVNVSLVGTVPEARRRGFGAALTWRAILADPALPAMLLATTDGRPVYERIGFLPLSRFAVWTRDRSGAG